MEPVICGSFVISSRSAAFRPGSSDFMMYFSKVSATSVFMLSGSELDSTEDWGMLNTSSSLALLLLCRCLSGTGAKSLVSDVVVAVLLLCTCVTSTGVDFELMLPLEDFELRELPDVVLIVSRPSSSTTVSEGAPLPARASFFARMISLFLGRCLGLEGSALGCTICGALGCTICGMLLTGRGGSGGSGLSLGGSGGREGGISSLVDCVLLLVFGDFFLGVATGGLAASPPPTEDVESDDSLLDLLTALILAAAGCWSTANCWNEKFK